MQHKPIVTKVFEANGYISETIITLNQFLILMNLLTTDNLSDNQTLLSLARQIWKQAETNKLQTIKVIQDELPVIQITTEYLISYIIDAIEILTTRTDQCRKTIQDLKQKQLQFEHKKDYPKLEVLQHKLTTLIKDNIQFEKDLRILTQSFQNESHRLTLIEEKNPRKNETLRSVESIRKQSIDKEVQVKKKIEDQTNKINCSELQQYMKENGNQPLDIETVDDQKKVCIWLLGLMIFLQITVVFVKFSFVNLMVFLLGMFVLLQPYRQNMVKIAYFSCMATLPLDILWIILYSQTYLSPAPNAGLTRIIKPYLQYIWFVTIVQLFVKLVFLLVLKKYQYLETVMFQQLQQEQQEMVQVKQSERLLKKYVDDHYLPNLKEFAKIDTIKE